MCLKFISSQLPRFCIRTVINIFEGEESDIGHYCSFVVLYAREDLLSKVKRIRQDSIEVVVGSVASFKPSYEFADVNHDGYGDMIFSFAENTSGNHFYNYFYVFDAETQTFEADTILFNLFHEQAISIYVGTREIIAGGATGYYGYAISKYRWNGKTYELYAEESKEEVYEIGLVRIRKELINGVWKIVESDTTPY